MGFDYIPHILESSTGLLSKQGEKSLNFYFIRVLSRKKVLKYGTPKPSQNSIIGLGGVGNVFMVWDCGVSGLRDASWPTAPADVLPQTP